MLPYFMAPRPLDPARALPGREVAILDPSTFTHRIFQVPLDAHDQRVQSGELSEAFFALGCFWGAEQLFWQQPGVANSSVGYMGGYTPNPNYRETCSGQTGHAETVRVVFDPTQTSYAKLLKVFLENHDPTQGNRQGNDVGTQYRSALFVVDDKQRQQADQAIRDFQQNLSSAGYGTITTEVAPAEQYFYAEDYHQQYLDANPDGYCPVHATGVRCG